MPDSTAPIDNLISLTDHQCARWQPESLDDLIFQLGSVDQLTEQVFLELGAQIRAFYSRGRKIAESASDSVSLLQAENTENTLPRLQLLVERCGLWLSDNQSRSAEICLLLSEVDKQLDALDVPLLMLRKVVKTLHSLRVTTRIEASKDRRLGAGVLGDALHRISDMIQEKLDEISTLLESLGLLNQTAVTAEQGISGGALREAGSEVDSARKGLALFSDARLEVSAWTRRLQGRSEELAASFGELVAALQFQDITRQRLEHIRSTLKALKKRLTEMSLATDISADREIEGLVGNICRLQHEQLQLSVDEFCDAADQLTLNLQGMAEGVVSLAADTRGLSQAADAGSVGQISQVTRMLESIVGRLETTQVAHSEARQALIDVCQAVEGVAGLVEDLEFVGEEMQLLAINAAISAAHARGRGAGLEVIAQNIQELSVGASEQAGVLAQECGCISDHAEHLNALEDDEGAGISALLRESKALLASLANNTGQLDDVTAVIEDDASLLSRDVMAVAHGVDVRERFVDNVQEVLEQLAAFGSRASSSVAGSHLTLEGLLEELEQRYTMSSERDVHRQFVTSQPESDVVDDPEESTDPEQEHGLGNNVVLF